MTSLESTHVTVGVNILTILEIVETDNLISLQLEVQVTWADSRLVMLDLHENSEMNVITESVARTLWLPEVTNLYTVVCCNTKRKNLTHC